jgi:lipoxygenase
MEHHRACPSMQKCVRTVQSKLQNHHTNHSIKQNIIMGKIVIQNHGQSGLKKSASIQGNITFSLLDSIDIINRTT